MLRKFALCVMLILFLLITAYSDYATTSSDLSSAATSTEISDSSDRRHTTGLPFDETDVELELVSVPSVQKPETRQSSNQTGSQTNSKTSSKSSLIDRRINYKKTDVLTEVFDGKEYVLKFKETQEPTVKWINGYDVYTADVADAGTVTAWYDCVTGDLLYFNIPDNEKVPDPISKDEAEKITYNFLKNYVYISEYSLTKSEHHSTIGGSTVKYKYFYIQYNVYIADYRTDRQISVTLSESGKITSFSNYPYDAFKNIKVEYVNQKAIIARMKEELNIKHNNQLLSF
ncbi:MAG: YcdB/YcdC domain-containing protein, partial [Acutalibacteraceae bacterium]